MAAAAISIGPVVIPGRAALGPLAGYTEYPFRAAVARFGCPFAVTPLVAAEGLCRRNEKTRALLATGPDDAAVVAAQIFGSRPRAMADAARAVADAGFPLVDVNLGCPAARIRRQLAGAALLEDVGALRRVVRAVVSASPIPVTAKMRLASSPGRTVALARLLVEEGVRALAVHGRTLAQGFRDPVDWEAIRETAAAVSVPVWANGGVRTPQDGADLLAKTGAAGVMVGRGILGRPWLVAAVGRLLDTARAPRPPARRELADIIWYHYELAAAAEDDARAAVRFRAHLVFYFKDVAGAKDLRERAVRVGCRADVANVVARFRDGPDDGP